MNIEIEEIIAAAARRSIEKTLKILLSKSAVKPNLMYF
jgi:hypothetical protein